MEMRSYNDSQSVASDLNNVTRLALQISVNDERRQLNELLSIIECFFSFFINSFCSASLIIFLILRFVCSWHRGFTVKSNLI